MKEKIEIHKGEKFNRLTVIDEYGKDKYGHKKFLCICDCGEETIVLKSQLTSGKTGSCGCYQKDRARETQFKHGMAKTAIYQIWKGIIQRCTNPKSKSYNNYGGRGIAICSDWIGESGFENFYEWSMSHGYKEKLTIDRIDNNSDYCPQNCRWVSRDVQANNKRNNILINHNGICKTVSEWSKITGINDRKIRQRIKKLNWDMERAITES